MEEYRNSRKVRYRDLSPAVVGADVCGRCGKIATSEDTFDYVSVGKDNRKEFHCTTCIRHKNADIVQIIRESATPNIPRNAPCPCGSGKKYKRCGCGYGVK